MARINQGILGGFSGKIGNVVGSSWKGIAVMKTLPLSVANPRTAKQVSQRTAFADSIELAQILLVGIIKPLWDRFAVKMSGFNSFVRSFVLIKAGSDLASKVKIAQGQMGLITELSGIIDVSDNKLQLTWIDDSGEGLKLGSDEIYVVVLDSNLKYIGQASAVAKREDEGCAVDLSVQTVSATAYNVYVAARREDGTVVSDTNYLSVTATD